MPTFKYRAKKDDGDVVEGTIAAGTHDDAVDKISRIGYFPTAVEQIVDGPGKSSSSGLLTGRIRSRDITTFSRQLASLLKSGVPLLRGIEVIGEQSENARFKEMLDDISGKIKEGASFSSALAGYPKVFLPLYLAVVRAGESSGNMEESLSRIADYLKKQNEILTRVRMALVYPIFMAFVGAAATVFMLVFVMPKLTGIFEGTGQELPVPTRIVLAASSYLRAYWPWIVGIMALGVLIIKRTVKSAAGRQTLDRLKLKLPVLGVFFLKVELARFCRTLEILIRSGVPILEAIRTASSVFGNEVLKVELTRTGEDLEHGGSFGQSLKKSKLFPAFMNSLVIVGEESGRLDESLAEVATSYERDTDEAVTTSTALLEPLMILIVGSVVGFMVVAMLLPIFEIDIMAGM